MGFLGVAHGSAFNFWGDKKDPPPKKFSHISYNDETWHSGTLPNKGAKYI